MNSASNQSNLPKGWVSVPASDLVKTKSGNSKLIKGKLHSTFEEGFWPAFSASGCDVWRDDWEHEGNAIIVSAVGARCGKAFLASGRWSAIANTHIVWPLEDRISAEYLWYFINNEDYWIKSGTAQPFVKVRSSFERYFKLPPLPEQHRIVEAIESYLTRLDDAVATLERVQRNLERYRASVLKAAVEGRLVPTEAELAKKEGRDYEPANVLLDRILEERRRRWIEDAAEKGRAKAAKKYKEPESPDTSKLPELPEGWCWATLPQLGEVNRGKSKHRPRNDPRLLGGAYPFIQTGDVRLADGFILEHNHTYSEFGLAQSRLWPKGTLCITIAANIAETGILGFEACFPDSVVGFLNPAEPTLTRFLEFFLRTARQELDRYAPATAQKNINLKVLSELAVPLPPASEQTRMIIEIDRLFSLATSSYNGANQGSLRAVRLRQSILKWGFEGKLVDQDPTDEPASALLERIIGERKTMESTKKASNRRGRKRKAK
ncbi:restriction endonuclease subunit S [bacterium]|nr:restriction endonuclease subunit S [bacterium]